MLGTCSTLSISKSARAWPYTALEITVKLDPLAIVIQTVSVDTDGRYYKHGRKIESQRCAAVGVNMMVTTEVAVAMS